MGEHKEEIFIHKKFLKVPFVVISGPSAGGKTDLSKKLEKYFPELCLLIKYTDRKPRATEKNFQDYFFVSTEEFEKKISAISALVRVYRYEHAYALSVSEVEKSLNLRKIPVFILDPNAALKFKKVYTNSILIFVAPKSVEVTRNRIKERKESLDEIEKRLENLNEEYSLRHLFDINDYCIDFFSVMEKLREKIAEIRR